MSDGERIEVNCPKCGHPNGFSKQELCGQTKSFWRYFYKSTRPEPKRRQVLLYGTCYNCDYDFSQYKLVIDCEGYE